MINEEILRENISSFLNKACPDGVPRSPDAFKVAENSGFDLVTNTQIKDQNGRSINYNPEDDKEKQQWDVARGLVNYIAL